MPKRNKLSDFEKGQIQAFDAENKSHREIARLIGRSPTVVDNYLRNTAEYGKKNPGGRPSKLSERDKRRIYRVASNSAKTSTSIKQELDLNVSSRTIRRAIHKNPNLKRVKLKRAPAIRAIHKRQRLAFARQNMNQNWLLVSWV